ncbi:uncharacterized protein LOC110448423 isoform X2 [Mizuhopecten yessoensis]|uniref:uncharacterized protein LOC110448423 isoform X2 n=1 Tax=Mizuhopecten yessoensis TaxID=6573 RepID=UPI000B45F7D8|nr:uncharacterized protein LOC110448423 isoform X2 [Mizuhopecten yessoensis]
MLSKKRSSEKMANKTPRYNLREGRHINWEIYFDTSYEKMMAKVRPTIPYGLKVHNFRRIIARKQIKERTMYLLEWENYELSEATWEPESILPKHISTTFSYPEVSEEALTLVARQFESAVQRCLARRIKYKSATPPSFCVDFPFDMFRYVFGTSDLGRQYNITYTNGFSKLPMSSGWTYYIDRHNNRCQLAFPVCIEPRLTMRKVFKNINGKFEWRRQPEEKVRVTLGFQPVDKYSKTAETTTAVDQPVTNTMFAPSV